MNKKKILIPASVGLCILLMIPIVIHFVNKTKQQVVRKIVENMAKKEGIDLDSPSSVSQKFDEIYERSSWDERTGKILKILDGESAERMKILLYSLEGPQRQTIINECGELMKRYRENMSEQEWNKLKRRLSDEKGQDMVKKTKGLYLQKFAPEQREELYPIVNEIMEILDEVER